MEEKKSRLDQYSDIKSQNDRLGHSPRILNDNNKTYHVTKDSQQKKSKKSNGFSLRYIFPFLLVLSAIILTGSFVWRTNRNPEIQNIPTAAAETTAGADDLQITEAVQSSGNVQPLETAQPPETIQSLETVQPSEIIVPSETAVYIPSETNVSANANGFYYLQLSDYAKIIYTALAQCVQNHNDSVSIELGNGWVLNENEIASVFRAVYYDYPEYFFFNGSGRWVQTGIQKIDLFPNYFYPAESISAYEAEIESIIAPVLTSVEYASDYEKVKTVYDFIIDHTIYDLAYTGHSVYDLFHSQRAVCEGYARAVGYMLKKLGVETIYVYGEANSGGTLESHAWNIVRVNGEYYELDATWGDPVSADGIQTRNYNYFLVTTEDIQKDHQRTADYNYPICTATEYNYYVQENRYLYSYDESAIQNALTEALSSGEKTSFRFADDAAYQTAVTQLFDNNGIWELLDRGTNGNYRGQVNRIAWSTKDTVRVVEIWFE